MVKEGQRVGKQTRDLAIQAETERKKRNRFTPSELQKMKPEVFRKHWSEAVRGGHIPNSMQEEFVDNRLEEKTALAGDIYDALFVLENPDGQFDALQDKAVITLYEQPTLAFSVSVLFMRANKELDPKIIVREERSESGSTFVAVGTARIGGSFVLSEGDVVDVEEATVVSQGFRSPDQATSRGLAAASLLAKMLVPDEVDKWMQEEAHVAGASRLSDAEVSKLTEGKKTKRIEGKEKRDYKALFHELCEQNGYEVVVDHNEINPEPGSYGHTTAVQIGTFRLERVGEFRSQKGAEVGVKRTLYNILRGPQVDTDMDVSSELAALVAGHDLPPYESTIERTKTPQGQELIHCITTIHHGDRDQVMIGSGQTEADARRIAAVKVFSVFTRLSQ